ncbi:FAD:protein FMN transferase [Chitinophaga sancti]|uniref:FAD:protein FMN transferase n=1 Tax=Chitinophaga sancti TaxID=1004 RepID=A0A1K1SLS6_9BACT|nr:FAD:protein FMN transferase [Chitinophaga sancti]WQD63884.1 FAD:protein FMN transferase [Chitinophaga sancti]WQG90491.1 FAD:protein FMN transferase [Chitinophaga sancti]SFW85283.1 thiamine biosynthesis lipoprotein [Chitinophaga sancti]
MLPENDIACLSDQVFRKVLKLMGNRFELTVVCENEQEAAAHIHAAIAEIRRIESLLTTFHEESQTSLINRNAGIRPVQVDKEVCDLIIRAGKISSLTQGAFDLSYGSVDKSLWNFDQHMTALPDPETARKMVRLIDYRNIWVNPAANEVMLREKGMRIGFGGIGKGYAAECAKALLRKRGVQSGIVNAAGDLTAWGTQPGGKPWTVGIADPDSTHHPFSYLNISDQAIATSGNYEKYAIINGKKYSHTIDPKTGLPVTGIKSVSIISTNAEIADAMATPVMIMGIRAGLNMINQMKQIACIIIDDQHQLFTSDNIQLR